MFGGAGKADPVPALLNYGLGLFIVKEIASIECTRCGFRNMDKGVEFWFDFVNCVMEEIK